MDADVYSLRPGLEALTAQSGLQRRTLILVYRVTSLEKISKSENYSATIV